MILVPFALAAHAVAGPGPQGYAVRAGDTLSAVAAAHHVPGGWPAIVIANKTVIINPDQVWPGEVLTLPDVAPPAAELAAVVAAAAPAPALRPAAAPGPSGRPLADSRPAVSAPVSAGGFRGCVIARESGGRPQVMNSSGHYGLYQFSESTWTAYGGSAASFGHAPAAEQDRVFANAMATPGGASNWSPYDGCVP